MLLAANAALRATMPDDEDPDWARHNQIADHAQVSHTHFLEAAYQLDVTPPAASWYIMLAAYLRAFDNPDSTFALCAIAPLIEVGLVDDESLLLPALVCKVTLPLAQVAGQGFILPPQSELLESADSWRLLSDFLDVDGYHDAAADAALISARIYRECGDARAAEVGRWALRQLYKSPRRAAGTLTPMAKYPPRKPSLIPPDVLREICCGAIQEMLFGPPPQGLVELALETTLLSMISDADAVFNMPLRGIRYDAGDAMCDLPDQHFELRFSRAMLLRLQTDSVREGGTLAAKAREVTLNLLEKPHLLAHWRDGFLHDWYSTDGRRSNRLDARYGNAIACVQSAPGHMLVIIGEAVNDIDAWQLYERYGYITRERLRRARSAVA